MPPPVEPVASAVRPRSGDVAVAYLTDVEGQWQRIETFCQGNPHVQLRIDAEGREHLDVAPGAMFVFGGDAIDRGPSSRRIVRLLLDAKERAPDQVVLLAGNRDLNKLRLTTELFGDPPKRAPDDVKGAPRPQLLQWILQHTMGAGDAFAHKRAELQGEGRPSDDAAVTQSFVDDLDNGGDLVRLLSRCQLSFRAGHTLFVHGGVAAEALTVVPGFDALPIDRFDVDEWGARLNSFYAEQLRAYHERRFRADGVPVWEDAILYQAPRRGMNGNPGSVVYGRMADDHNNPQLPERAAVRALLASGVRRLVVGHTPTGDVPSILRATDERSGAMSGRHFEVVMADNSRSRVDSGTRLVVTDASIAWRGRCVLDGGDERTVDATLFLDDVHTAIGKRQVGKKSVIKAGFDDGWLTFLYKPGYQLEQRLERDLDELEDPL